MIFRVLCLIVFGSFAFGSYANKCDSIEYTDFIFTQGGKAENLDSFFTAQIRYVNHNECGSGLLEMVQYRYGVELFKDTLYTRAINQLEVVEKLFEESQNRRLFMSFAVKAEAYESLNLMEEASIHYKKAITIQRVLKDSTLLDYHVLNLGRVHRNQGDFKNALDYIQQSVFLHQKLSGENSIYTGEAWRELGITYTKARQFRNAISSLDNTLRIALLENRKSEIGNAFIAYGNAYEQVDSLQQALKYYNKALKLLPPSSVNSDRVRTNIGYVLFRLGEYDTAQEFAHKSLNLKKQKGGIYNFNYATSYENLGDIYSAQNKLDASLLSYQLALINLTNEFRELSFEMNPHPDSFYVYSKPQLIRTLDLKAQAALQYYNDDKNKNIKYQNLAFETYQIIDKWVSTFYQDLKSEASTLEWTKRLHKIYGNAIEVAINKGEYSTAFGFAERAKAVLLWQNLSQENAMSVLNQEDSIKLAGLRIEIAEANLNYSKTEDKKFLETKHLLEWKKEALIKKYPEYYTRIYGKKFISVKEIQAGILNHRTALLEYFLTKNKLYIFLITEDTIQVDTIQIDGDFISSIEALREGIKKSKDGVNPAAYNALAFSIYEQILKPVINKLDDQIDELILVPDQELNFIPFAALVNKSLEINSFAHNNYVVNDFSINYFYSCNSYFQLQNNNTNRKGDYLGVAPNFIKNPGKWRALENNIEEVKRAFKIWGGDTLIAEMATFDNVQSHIHQNKISILQLATHADQTKDGSVIAFANNEETTQQQIQNSNWPIWQIILSACKTGDGKLSPGEGILSLGWSFAYKGVASILMSQWAVEDESTMKITTSFHKYMKNGLPSHKALREAQLGFLSTASPDKFAPYFWAPFIHNGYVGAPKPQTYYRWFICIFIVFLAGWFFNRNTT